MKLQTLQALQALQLKKKGHWKDHGRLLEVHISKHSPFSSQDHGRLSAVLWCGGVVCIFVCFPSILFFLFLALSFLLLSSYLCSLFSSSFECDLAHGRCRTVGSLPPLPFLPSLPSTKKKKEEFFFLQEHVQRGNYLKVQFYIKSKNRRRGK